MQPEIVFGFQDKCMSMIMDSLGDSYKPIDDGLSYIL